VLSLSNNPLGVELDVQTDPGGKQAIAEEVGAEGEGDAPEQAQRGQAQRGREGAHTVPTHQEEAEEESDP